MDKTTLGRTGLRVSVAGFGCGGPSRAGRSTGKSEDEQVDIIRQALDAGVNLIDTAEAYQTEEVVGRAIQGRDRDAVVISTKKSTRGEPLTPQHLEEGLHASLRRLGTDYVDIYHLHAVEPQDYEALSSRLGDTLLKLRDQGKVRFLGITEQGNRDTDHQMLQRALQDDLWDVMMVTFNLLNQSARERVFTVTQEKNIGVLNMFAVRLALSRPERLREVVGELIARGEIDPAEIDPAAPLGFLLEDGIAESIPDAAYRFCRDEPGVHVVLSGTGNPAHLQQNLASFTRPPLPGHVVQRLKHLFRQVDSVSGQ
jgi:aryl-alcohol dehydrogenase-like predicted oxidoreductase